MLKKLVNKVHKVEAGITGLETAIILIAFVVVAAVFAYTVLSAGLFSTQKSQQAVYSGLEEAQSSLEMKGAVIAKATTTGSSGTIGQLTFTVANSLGGAPMNFTAPGGTDNDGGADSGSSNVVVVSYIDKDQRVEDLYWTVTKLGNADTDDLLEEGEKFQVTIGGSTTAGASGGNLVDALTTDLSVNKTFTIEVKTPHGGLLTFERTTPAYIDAVINMN
jgi:archaeal flagellin FlaB